MKKKAQSMTEYAILIAIFLAAVIVAQNYLKRAMANKWKESADRISTEQFGASYNGTSWDFASSNEITGTNDAITNKYWTESKLITEGASGLSLKNEVGINATIPENVGQVSRHDWSIDYDLKGGEKDIWGE